jgi:hypothetical protein
MRMKSVQSAVAYPTICDCIRPIVQTHCVPNDQCVTGVRPFVTVSESSKRIEYSCEDLA